MPIYINGRPVNPVISFLVSAACFAGIVGLGILLLPLIGWLFLMLLLAVAGIALYGLYWRWRYGDPFKRMQEEAVKQMQRRAAQAQGMHEEMREEVRTAQAAQTRARTGQAKAGVRRRVTVEDAVVIEEIKRRE